MHACFQGVLRFATLSNGARDPRTVRVESAATNHAAENDIGPIAHLSRFLYPCAVSYTHLFAGLDSIVEEPIWKTLFASVVDVLFPKKLPPLKLSSRPIAVRDPMAVKRNPASSAVSFITHAVIIGLILLFTLEQWHERALQKKLAVTPVDVTPFIPAAPMKQTMGGGGGGGNHEIVEASKGCLLYTSRCV